MLLLLSIGMLVACDNTTITFTVSVPGQITVGDTFMITVEDDDQAPIDATDIDVTIKTGQGLITINGLSAEAIEAGDVVLTVTVTIGEQSSSQDFSFTIMEPEIIYGIPEPESGRYMIEADVIDDGTNRLLTYVTNTESGVEDNVIALRIGQNSMSDGYVYGDEIVAITPSADGWDQFIGGPSVVKGNFSYQGMNYQLLMAYQGTSSTQDNAYSIGLAVAQFPQGPWTKVGTEPVLAYDSGIYGESYAGHYAPSLVNLDHDGVIRLFYTWADAYGHFTYFVDFDASDLDQIDLSGFAMMPINGNLSSGEDVTMIPNADLAYDSTTNTFYAIKDYSPTPSREPMVATRIELAWILEEELYTAIPGLGWRSLRLYDMFDTPDTLYERLYAGSIVSDMFGHVIDPDRIEIIYNVSDLEADNTDHIFSQKLLTFIFEQ